MDNATHNQFIDLHQEHATIKERLARLELVVQAVPEMDKKLDHLLTLSSKYHGFIGGIAFIFTGIVIFIKGGWEMFTHFFKG
jgi:hypothetical protein